MATNYLCKNCEKTCDPSFTYCPSCGQETANELTVGVLFSNTISNYFSIDGRFFKSFIPLMIKPGALAKRFVDGKRRLYLHPAQFYLFISILFFFLFSFSVRKADDQISRTLKNVFSQEVSIDSLAINREEIDQAIDSLVTAKQKIAGNSFSFQKEVLDSLIAHGAPEAEKLLAMGKKEEAGLLTTRVFVQVLKLYEQKGGGIVQALYDTIPIAMFVLLPLFAFLLKLMYWKRGTFAHHIVFSFYFFTFLFTTFCARILVNTMVSIPLWIDVIVFMSFIVYLMMALRHFYESSRKWAFYKGAFISITYLFLFLPLATVGIIFVSFLLY